MQKKPSLAISTEEHHRLLGLTNEEELKNVLILLHETGLRPADLLRLTAEEINWEREVIVVHLLKFGGRAHAVLSITPEIKIVLQQLPFEGPLFPSFAIRPTHHFRQVFSQLRCRASLPASVTVHSYRLRRWKTLSA